MADDDLPARVIVRKTVERIDHNYKYAEKRTQASLKSKG